MRVQVELRGRAACTAHLTHSLRSGRVIVESGIMQWVYELRGTYPQVCIRFLLFSARARVCVLAADERTAVQEA